MNNSTTTKTAEEILRKHTEPHYVFTEDVTEKEILDFRNAQVEAMNEYAETYHQAKQKETLDKLLEKILSMRWISRVYNEDVINSSFIISSFKELEK